MSEESGTRIRILEAAQDLVQRIGANAMSYQHISNIVGIRKASIHHHFPAKEDLLEAMILRYSEQFFGILRDIEESRLTPLRKLQRYIALFEATLCEGDGDRACPIGMLGAELATLGGKSVSLIVHFREENERFLQGILEQGRKEKQFQFPGDLNGTAALIFTLLEGEVLIARGANGQQHFSAVASQLLRLLRG